MLDVDPSTSSRRWRVMVLRPGGETREGEVSGAIVADAGDGMIGRDGIDAGVEMSGHESDLSLVGEATFGT